MGGALRGERRCMNLGVDLFGLYGVGNSFLGYLSSIGNDK